MADNQTSGKEAPHCVTFVLVPSFSGFECTTFTIGSTFTLNPTGDVLSDYAGSTLEYSYNYDSSEYSFVSVATGKQTATATSPVSSTAHSSSQSTTENKPSSTSSMSESQASKSTASSTPSSTPDSKAGSGSENRAFGAPIIIGIVIGILALVVAVLTLVINWKALAVQWHSLRNKTRGEGSDFELTPGVR
jgi:hypothetical protein